jgi:hypothetical protein
MRQAILSLLICAAAFASAPPTFGQPPAKKATAVKKPAARSKAKAGGMPFKVDGNTVTVALSFPVTFTVPEGHDLYLWSVPAKVKAQQNPGEDNVLVVTDAPAGAHEIKVSAATTEYEFDKDGKVVFDAKGKPKKKRTNDSGTYTLYVGKLPGPTPDPIDPPGPPDPPPPDPDVKPPIPGDGLRVMIIFESRYPEKLTSGQRAAVNGRGEDSLSAYLTAKCAKELTGQPAFRFADQHATAEADFPVWQEALKRPRKSVPWIIIGAGAKGGFEGPLPATHGEIMALVKKFGGE